MRRSIPRRDYVLLAAGVAFFAGCRLGGAVTGGAWLLWLLGIGIMLGALALWRRRSLLLAAAVCFCALGILRVQPALYPSTPKPGSYGQIVGYVYGAATLRPDERITFTLGDISLDGRAVPGRAYCSVSYEDEPPVLFDGARVSMPGSLYRPGGKEGAARFDFREWMLQNGMAFGISAYDGITVENTQETAPVKDWAYRLKERFRSSLEKTMGDGADLAMALLFSDKSGIRAEEKQLFNRLGIAHIMSVSGLHVGIVAGLLFRLLGFFRLGKSRWFLLAGALAFYCMLTGFSAASMRAAVMLLLGYAAIMGRRPRAPLNHLGIALIVLLLVKPMHAFSAGLILSVSAVLGIYLIKPALSRLIFSRWDEPEPAHAQETVWRKWLRRFGRKAKDGFLFSLSAQVGVLLPTAYFFQQLPVYGVLINMAIVPYVGLLVPVQLAALVLSPLPGLGQAAGWLAAAMGDVLLWAAQLVNRLPMAAVQVGKTDVLWLFVALMSVIAVSGMFRLRAWRRMTAVLAAAAVAAAGIAVSMPPATRYIQLSVGQADAALLFDEDCTIAIDVGVDGEATLDYLEDAGRQLDVLYLTHLHIDHAGGVPYLLDSGIRIGQVYLPVEAENQRLDEDSLAVLERIRQEGIPVREIAAGEVHTYPTVTITALWPKAETIRTGQDANDLPLVLQIGMGGYTILSAADLTGRYENYAAVPANVLKAAHHGSSESTGTAFLEATVPGLVLISCGRGSSYLPGEEMLERLKEKGIPYYRTDETGDITLCVQNGQLTVAPYKEVP